MTRLLPLFVALLWLPLMNSLVSTKCGRFIDPEVPTGDSLVFDMRSWHPHASNYYHSMVDSCVYIFPIIKELSQTYHDRKFKVLVSGGKCHLHLRPLMGPNVEIAHLYNGEQRQAHKLDWKSTGADRHSCLPELRNAWVKKLNLSRNTVKETEPKSVVIVVRKETRKFLNVDALVTGLATSGLGPFHITFLHGNESVPVLVKTMHCAWAMIHVHGAAMANAIYMSPMAAGVVEVTFRRDKKFAAIKHQERMFAQFLDSNVWRSNSEAMFHHQIPVAVALLESCNNMDENTCKSDRGGMQRKNANVYLRENDVLHIIEKLDYLIRRAIRYNSR